MLISHVYAEILSLAPVYYDALQIILQTGLGWVGVFGWFVVVVPHPAPLPHLKLRSDMLCTLRLILALECELLRSSFKLKSS